MELVTIKTFENIIQLGIVQSYLESEGIASYVKDENIGQAYAGAIDSLRIKLQVEEDDVQQAIQILITAGFAKPEDYELDNTLLRISRFLSKFSNWFKKN